MGLNQLTKPSTFSEAFRNNVTIRGALCAMLASEEIQGQNTLATKTQIAIENMHSDILTLSEVHSGFSSKTTEDDALNELMKQAYSLLGDEDQDLMPDEAVTQIIEDHQKRRFPTVESAKERIMIVHQAFAMAGHFLKKCEAA
jgi:hypothetical protein